MTARTADRLHPGRPLTDPLTVLIVGPSELAGVDAEAERMASLLTAHGHRVSCRLAPRTAWEQIGRAHV